MAKILLAEDDTFLQDIYTEALKEAGFTVTLAVDGEEALQKIKEGGWDLVLLDIMMPKLTGIEVLKKLENMDLHSLARHIVLLTNNEEVKELQDVIHMVDGYVMKSMFTPGQLMDKVKGYLEKE